MTDYVKSTNFASKDALATGNPLKIVKGTEIDTEFNNIATAVATKSDLNSPAFIGTPTAPTPSAGNNTTLLATTAFVTSAITAAVAATKAALFPVGSIYTNSTDSTNPATLLGFGTWVAFGAGRVPVGFDAGNALFNSAEETGGSYNAVLPSHTHSWSGSSSGSVGSTDLSHTHGFSASFSGSTGGQSAGHSHTFSGTTSGVGDHQHYTINTNTTDNNSQFSVTVNTGNSVAGIGASGFEAYTLNGQSSGANAGLTSSAGAHSHTYSGTTSGTSGDHSHGFSGSVSGTTGGASVGMSHNHSVSVSTSGSNSTEGVSATNANIQPYITVYMWKRTA